MRFQVILTADAERDIEDIVVYIGGHDSQANATHVFNRIVEIAESLETSPERGSQPKELQSLGGGEYRQVFFKPYRLIYRIVEKQVIVYLVADGRRDLQSLLLRRLFSA
jgi:toxin ParE1/3/4